MNASVIRGLEQMSTVVIVLDLIQDQDQEVFNVKLMYCNVELIINQFNVNSRSLSQRAKSLFNFAE